MAQINTRFFLLFTRPTERSPETDVMVQSLNYCCLISTEAVRNYFLTLATLTAYTSTIRSSILRIHPEDWEWARDLFKVILVPKLRITLCYPKSLFALPATFDILTYIYYTRVYFKSINTELFCWILLQSPQWLITFLLLTRDTWVQLCSTTRALLTLLGTTRSWPYVCKIWQKRQSKSTGTVNEQMLH